MADEVETEIEEAPVIEAEEAVEGEEATEEQEIVISIGDEELPTDDDDADVPEGAQAWARELRKLHREEKRGSREKDRRIAELEAKLNGTAPQATEIGPEPTLESCGYDEEEFKSTWRAWDKKQVAAEAAAEAARKAQEDADAAWEAKKAAYEDSKGALGVPDYDDVEHVLSETLDETKRGIIIHASKNPALLSYAIGKNKAKIEELSKMDPVTFAFEAGKMEAAIKVTKRNTVPAPERTISSTGSLAASVDGTLDRLRAEAAKTNDYSKVLAYKRQKAAG